MHPLSSNVAMDSGIHPSPSESLPSDQKLFLLTASLHLTTLLTLITSVGLTLLTLMTSAGLPWESSLGDAQESFYI